MSLTLLKGLMPHVPQMLPFLISDPEMRSRAEETFLSPEFQENIEEYFVNNIKVRQSSLATFSLVVWRHSLHRGHLTITRKHKTDRCTVYCPPPPPPPQHEK